MPRERTTLISSAFSRDPGSACAAVLAERFLGRRAAADVGAAKREPKMLRFSGTVRKRAAHRGLVGAALQTRRLRDQARRRQRRPRPALRRSCRFYTNFFTNCLRRPAAGSVGQPAVRLAAGSRRIRRSWAAGRCWRSLCWRCGVAVLRRLLSGCCVRVAAGHVASAHLRWAGCSICWQVFCSRAAGAVCRLGGPPAARASAGSVLWQRRWPPGAGGKPVNHGCGPGGASVSVTAGEQEHEGHPSNHGSAKPGLRQGTCSAEEETVLSLPA